MSHALASMSRHEFLERLDSLLAACTAQHGSIPRFQKALQQLLFEDGKVLTLRLADRMGGATRVFVEVPASEDLEEYCAALQDYVDGRLTVEPAPHQWGTSNIMAARKAALDSLKGLRSR